MDEETRCAICGIPNYVLRKYQRDGPWFKFLGPRKSGRRLQLDHITPGVNDGQYRPLCPGCNAKRGAAVFSDEDVLLWVRDMWRFILPLRFLWWLNSTPGKGGRTWRSDRVARRYAKLVGMHSGTAVPPPTSETATPSSSTTSAPDVGQS
jgi:hypothetical protein